MKNIIVNWYGFILSKPDSSIIQTSSSTLSVIAIKLRLPIYLILLKELGMYQPTIHKHKLTIQLELKETSL